MVISRESWIYAQDKLKDPKKAAEAEIAVDDREVGGRESAREQSEDPVVCSAAKQRGRERKP